jgi:hypothetical protein
MTADPVRERRLAEADHHIALAETLIARQENILSELERDGHETENARVLLEVMRESLRQMHVHRRIIEVELSGPADPT